MIKSSRSVTYILLFVGILYAVLALNAISPFDLRTLGLIPRDIQGLRGIFLSPFLHADITHLVSNTVPLMILMGITFIFYQNVALRATLWIWLLSGVLLWCFGRPVIHIGASGLIYGYAAFLVTKGFVDRDFKSMAIAVAVILFYGGITYGLLPVRAGVSFEGHIFGALAGVFGGRRLRRNVSQKTNDN